MNAFPVQSFVFVFVLRLISLQKVRLRLTFYSSFVTTEIFLMWFCPPPRLPFSRAPSPITTALCVLIVPRCGVLSVCDLIITRKLPVYLNTLPPLGWINGKARDGFLTDGAPLKGILTMEPAQPRAKWTFPPCWVFSSAPFSLGEFESVFRTDGFSWGSADPHEGPAPASGAAWAPGPAPWGFSPVPEIGSLSTAADRTWQPRTRHAGRV